jgi:NAD+ dependent glucose-6-phosphate dehydrogenase
MTNNFRSLGITGAGGNVGRTLQRGLAAEYDLRLFDRAPIQPEISGAAYTADFGEPGAWTEQFQGLDALIHLAGDPRPNAPAASTYRNNFRAASYVFEAARRAGVKKIVFASSNFYHEGAIRAALTAPHSPLIQLTDNPTPLCLYGQSKVFGEEVGRHYAHLGVQFAALRIGWTVPEDNPARYWGDYMRAVFCSHRDLVGFVRTALGIERDFLVAFAVSANQRGIFDLEETTALLGFTPQDDAEAYGR